MRIGIVAPEFPPDIGGIETYSLELARALHERGHDVTVFTVPHREGEVAVPGIIVLPVLKQRRRLDRHITREYAMDVWHATNAAYAWLAREVPQVVVSVHGNDFLRPYIDVGRPDLHRLPGMWRYRPHLDAIDREIGRWLTNRLVRQWLPRVHCLVANSRYTKTALIDRYPRCAGKVIVGLVGVASEFLRTAHLPRIPGEPSRLLTVCRLSEPRKNVDLVLRSLAGLKDRYDFTYTIVGDGHLRPGLEELADGLGLGHRVCFTGRLDQTALRQRMASSDLFVLTSGVLPASHEGFGIAYLEANACGTPVLAARLAGVVEAVAEGESGMFIDKPNVPALQAALDKFLSGAIAFDPTVCRAHATKFAWGRVVDRILVAYESCRECTVAVAQER